MHTTDLNATVPPGSKRKALATLTKALDLARAEKGEAVKGLLERGAVQLVPYVSYWAFRQLGVAVSILGGPLTPIVLRHCTTLLGRAQALSELLGPSGELCLECVASGREPSAAPAVGELFDHSGKEPIPVCEEHDTDAARRWDMVNPQLTPLTSPWPPWSMAPAWTERRPDTFSQERFAYAAWQQALQGDVNAMFWMGMIYELGGGWAKIPDAAEMWYDKAASKGFPGASAAADRVRRAGPWTRASDGATPWYMY